MLTYKAPVDDAVFLLRDVLKVDNELAEPIIQEAAKLAEEVIAPSNQVGDKTGCFYLKPGPGSEYPQVATPQAFKEPWKQFTEGGWIGLNVPEEYGGQGQPYVLATVVNEFISSANMAFSLYPGLTRGAIQALLEVGSAPFKQHYIPRMVTGEWTGTMNLTEPHCGTDLGLLKTKAVNKGNGSYEITGQKIFISCGEHDLSDNIIHLVLARVEGAPEGVKGISLFVVPKTLVDFSRNKVSCGSIEEKMGIHGSSTCVMNFDGATGFLLGEENKGLQAMFIMMNEARLGVAVQGLSQSELAYQNAVQYAKDRVQSPKLTDPKGGSVSIINHPDVRRMLLDIKSVTLPSRLLVYETALLVDNKSQAAQDKLGLLTPILKTMLTDYGFEHAAKAQQVFGGHGYIKEWGMEQIVRDARITQIYEGANGIQALDLVVRKMPKDMGRAIRTLFDETKAYLDEAEKNGHPWAATVRESGRDGGKAFKWMMANAMGNPNNAGSAAYDYLRIVGLYMLGISWMKILDATQDEDKQIVAKYFMERILPETKFLSDRIQKGSNTMMSLPVDKF